MTEWNKTRENLSLLKIAKELHYFSVPLMLNQFLSILISSFLAALIGRISVVAIASTEVVDQFMYALIGLLGAGVISFNIHASRVREKDPTQFYDWFKSIFKINLYIGLIAVFVTAILAPSILKMLYHFQGKALIIGTRYAKIQSLTILLYLMIFAMSNLLKVKKKTKEILLVGGVASIIQLLFAYILTVFVMDGENRMLGIAIATVISLFLQVIFYVYLLKDDFLTIRHIKDTKKRTLLIKSLPLVGQELLEGSLFQVVMMSLIAKNGLMTVSAYGVSMKLIAIALVPMYMYCNAMIVLIGERVAKKKGQEILQLLKITIVIITMIYMVFGILFYITRSFVIPFFTTIISVQKHAQQIFGGVLVLSAFQIYFEGSKYALQSLTKERFVVLITAVVNGMMMGLLLIFSMFTKLSLFTILSAIAFNYMLLAILFFIKFTRVVDKLKI